MFKNTLEKFGYPETLVKEYEYWRLLCRYEQVTLGSLILIYKTEVDAFSKVSPEGFTELAVIVPEVETKLKTIFNYEKINWMMLMMKDPEVHFHVIPRYSADKEFEGINFKDQFWPSAPRLKEVNQIDHSILIKLVEKMKAAFRA